MNALDEIRKDKTSLEVSLAKIIREFEDKYPGFNVEKIEYARYPNLQFNNYGQSYINVTVKVPSL